MNRVNRTKKYISSFLLILMMLSLFSTATFAAEKKFPFPAIWLLLKGETRVGCAYGEFLFFDDLHRKVFFICDINKQNAECRFSEEISTELKNRVKDDSKRWELNEPGTCDFENEEIDSLF